MSLRSRLAMSRRVKIGSATAVAGLALLGSGLSAPVSASAPTVEAPAPAVQKAVKQETKQNAKQAARRDCRVPNCWGAIQMAYGDGLAAYSYNYASKRRAHQAAHRLCDRHTRYPCRRIVATRNSCAAVAVRWNGHGGIARWAASWGYPSKRTAIRRALRKCRSDGGRCSKRIHVCTSRNY
jgi:hypothetical protein